MSTSLLGVSSGIATGKASAPQVPWCVFCWWLQKGVQENTAWPKAIDFYALSCGSFRKPACNLVETAQRKSQQVKIWMQDANGISQGLPRIVKDILDKRCSSTDDMANSIWFLQESVFALHQSLYEERCVTEEEFKQLQQELKEQVKKQQEELQKQQKLNQTEVTPTLPERNSKKV